MSAVQRVNHRARLKSINAFEAIAFTSKQSLRWWACSALGGGTMHGGTRCRGIFGRLVARCHFIVTFTSPSPARPGGGWAPSTVGVTTHCGGGGTFDEVEATVDDGGSLDLEVEPEEAVSPPRQLPIETFAAVTGIAAVLFRFFDTFESCEEGELAAEDDVILVLVCFECDTMPVLADIAVIFVLD